MIIYIDLIKKTELIKKTDLIKKIFIEILVFNKNWNKF